MSLAAVTTATLIGLTLNAAPASAAQAVTRAYANSGSPRYVDVGDGGYHNIGRNVVTFTACDTYPDGQRIVAWFSWQGGSRTVVDANGANNGCTSENVYVAEYTRIDANVCRQDGASGTPNACSGSRFLGYS